MEPLLTVDDPDWISFKEGDDAFLLRAAGDLIRRWCGWHIWPNVTMTVPNLRVGSAGIIMLPSLFVTEVTELQVAGQVLDTDDYVWFREGYAQVPTTTPWTGGYYGYVPGGYAPASGGAFAEVTMSHGYFDVPIEIKQIAFELVNASSEMPSGNVKDIQTPGFRLSLSQDPGLALNCTQRDRLAPFKLSWTR